MTITYLKFMKHAEKVSATASKSRPILAGVLHKDRSLAVTDSHRLYYAVGIAPEGEMSVINPKTGDELAEGKYPDFERLIPLKDDAKAQFIINADFASKATKIIENAEKINGQNRVRITAVSNELFITSDGEELVASALIGKRVDTNEEEFVMYADAKYVSEAFALLKDSKSESVEFRYYGELRPFTINTDGGVTALILPIRKETIN